MFTETYSVHVTRNGEVLVLYFFLPVVCCGCRLHIFLRLITASHSPSEQMDKRDIMWRNAGSAT